jgi:hypothetical protein
MLKNIFLWILTNVFKVKTETKQSEIDENQRYANNYERIDEINFNAIFSNKLANYVINDSEIVVDGKTDRAKKFNDIAQSIWKNGKKIVSMGFGYGGVFLIPYTKNGKLYYNKVPQNRVTIDSTDGDDITGMTVLADKKVISQGLKTKTYIRLSNYRIEKDKLIMEQSFTDEEGHPVPVPDFWKSIPVKIVISNVTKVPAGYIKSPANNRRSNDKYGVPIDYGTESIQKEIKECLKQLAREYDVKQSFIGADVTMFDKNDRLPANGLYQKVDSGRDDFWEIFSPEIRETSYYVRLQELYKRLEHAIGTSSGILSDVETQNATATEIKKAMYDTFSITDDMRTSFEKGIRDFFDGCDIIANAYNLIKQGEYDIAFTWSYGLIEDPTAEYSQLLQGHNIGVVSKAEIRQWIRPDEDLKEAQKKIDEIQEQEESLDKLLGEDKEEKEVDKK